jgi:DNA-binding NtrC family response regulator
MLPSDLPRTIEVLLAGDQHLQSALNRIFHDSTWRLHHVMTCRAAIEFANDHETAVVICQHRLPDGDWIALLAGLEMSGRRPNLIVTAPQPDEQLWAEVLNLGGYDVLAQPLDRHEVFRVVASAWRRWHLSWQMACP